MIARLYGDDPTALNVGVLNAPAVAIDTETTGLEWADKITMISMGWRDPSGGLRSCVLVPEDHFEFDAVRGIVIGDVGDLIQDILNTRRTVFHNLPFDFRFLWKRYDIKPTTNMHDTMHLAKQVGWFDSLSLAEVYRSRVGDTPAWVDEVKEHRKTFMRIPLETRLEYSAWDAQATLQIYEALRQEAVGVIPAGLYRRDLEFSKLVMEMIMRGIQVDKNFALTNIEKFQYRIGELAYKYVDHVTNLNSDDQIRNYLFETVGVNSDNLPRTPKGKISVAAEVLDTLTQEYPDIEALSDVVEYRQLMKCTKDWLAEFLALAEDTGRVHAELHPFGTRSFRMTSKTPNMLALPMEDRGRAFGSLQGLFVGDGDRELWGMDLKQAEVRLGAMLAQEDRLAEVFQTDADPYAEMAVSIWGQVDKDLRRRAKAAMLAGLYEIGPRTFALKNKVSVEEARRILDDFRARFPNIRSASQFYADFAEKAGYVLMHDGRRRYFARDDAFYKAFNQRVQGGVAEIMQPLMLETERLYPGALALQIHDAIILQAPKDEVARNKMFDTLRQVAIECVPEEVRNMTNPVIPFILEEKRWQ